ncbi:MAG TPA: hypothetical protein VGF18_03130 [Candidatus Tumulicola sp.]|jgi:uncharacterized membrane protein YagU involved in acid resistance
MATLARPAWGSIVSRGATAGIIGGITIDVYLWLTTLIPAHTPITAMWQFVASTAFGKGALTNPSFIWVGLAMHLIVSIGWGIGYAYIAASSPAIANRWITSGIVYGIVVYAIMSLILLADNNFTYPSSPNAFVNAIAAHAIFFGLPVAFVINRSSRAAA